MRKETQKSIDNFTAVFDTLFPDGNVPPFQEIQKKVNSGDLTFREAQIAKLYSNGSQAINALTDVDSQAYKVLQKTNPDVLEKAEKFYGVFGAAKNPQLISGIRSNISNYSNKFENVLDTPFSEIQNRIATGGKQFSSLQTDVKAFERVFSNVKAGKSVEGLVTGGTRIFNSIPDEQALKELLGGIAKIPDEELRHATYLAMLGYRGQALQGISSTLESATEGEDIFPYFDPETEQIVKPDVKKPGKKPLPPTSKPGPVAVDVLKARMANASEFGELFPNIDRNAIAAALNEHVYPNLSESTTKKLGRTPSGYTDMRRFFASAVANLLGDVKQASVLIGHTAGAESLEGEIDKVLTNHYAKLTQATAKAEDIRHKTLFAYESILARVLGKKTSNQLAEFLKLPFEDGVTARYPENDTDILTGDSTTSTKTNKVVESPEEAEQRSKTNIAQMKEIETSAERAALQNLQQIQQETKTIAAGMPDFIQQQKVIAQGQAEVALDKSGAKAQVKKERKVATGKELIAKALKGAKPIIKVVAPPVGFGISALAAKRTKADVTQQLEQLGLPGPVSEVGGAVAGATEFLPIAPSDVVAAARQIPETPSMVQAAQARQPDAPTATPPAVPSLAPPVPSLQPNTTNLPRIQITESEPFQRRQGMLSAEGAQDRVNQARSAALAGEETTLRGSFLN